MLHARPLAFFTQVRAFARACLDTRRCRTRIVLYTYVHSRLLSSRGARQRLGGEEDLVPGHSRGDEVGDGLPDANLHGGQTPMRCAR